MLFLLGALYFMVFFETTLGTVATSPLTTRGPFFNSSWSLSDRLRYAGPTGVSTCSLKYPFCTLQGSGHALDGLRDYCVLWDNSCTGDKASAAQRFLPEFNMTLRNNFCFFNPSEKCTVSNPPGRMSAFAAVRDWMRSPQCSAKQSEVRSNPTWEDIPGNFSQWTCCGPCSSSNDIHVNIYYWQDANADTSCLNIINKANHSAFDGLTKNSNHPYWGCTSFGPSTKKIITTAVIFQEQDTPIRVNLYNPWDPSPCDNHTNPSDPISPNLSTRTASPSGLTASTYSRAHAMMINERGASTLVSGGFTFTSPSIYANFHPLGVYDNCGATSIPSKILAFAPGELSTIVGQTQLFAPTKSAPFNTADMPCPPRSIMSEQWYSPLPGLPYLPNIALPKDIGQKIPEFQRCGIDAVYAWDPPRALQPAAAMDGPTTADMPIPVPTLAPSPNATPDPDTAKKTAPDNNPTLSQPTNAVQAPSFQPAATPNQLDSSIPNKDPANEANIDPAPATPSPVQAPNSPQPQQPQSLSQLLDPSSLPPAAAPSSIFTVGDTTFTANPTAFQIAAGTTLSAGGSAVVVAGTTLSLNPLGSLLVGSRTVSLTTPRPSQIPDDPLKANSSPSPSPLLMTASEGGEVFSVEPGWGNGRPVVAVAGTTLSAGGAGATVTPTATGLVQGPRVGLFITVSSGWVEVGTQSIALPPSASLGGEPWNVSATAGSDGGGPGAAVFTGDAAVLEVSSWLWWYGGIVIASLV